LAELSEISSTENLSMKLKELIKSKSYSEIPELKIKLELLYHADYWDGVISGMVRIDKELLWLQMIEENEDENDDSWYIKYAIVKLSKSQIELELSVHHDFQKYVGTHCDYIFLKPPPMFEEGKMTFFYDKHGEYTKSRDFGENEIVGWIKH